VRRQRVLEGHSSAEAFARVAEVHPATILGLERGGRVGDATVAHVEHTLGWASGSIRRYIETGDTSLLVRRPEVVDVPVETANGTRTVTIATLDLPDPEQRRKAIAVAKAFGWEITGEKA
jgi:hypothetical protein